MRISTRLALVLSAAAGGCLAIFVAQQHASAAPASPDPPAPGVVIPANGNMAAMEDPQGPADQALEPDVQTEVQSLVSPGPAAETDIGQADMKTLRVLLRPSGSDDVIYAFRTDAGRTCIGLKGQSAGCMSGFPASGINWVILNGGASSRSMIWGAATDDVTGIDVVTPAARYSMQLENNAFYGEVPDASASRDFAFEVSHANGTSATVDVARSSGAHSSH